MTLIQASPTEIRELDINAFRLTLKNLEDDEAGMSFPATHNHNTEVTVGGVTLARVVELINDYTVTFEDGQYAVNITGANSNIADKVNVNQVSVRAANSAGLVHVKEISEATEATKRLIEGLRPHHKGYGNIWYWNAKNGNDTNDGKSSSNAFKTFARAHEAAVDWGHDVIIVVPFGDSLTMLTEPLTITKNFLFVRGMGFNAHLHPMTTTAGGNLIDISGKGVEISGFHIEGINITAPNCNGINVTNSHVLIKDCTIEECTGYGVVITSTAADDRSIIQSCFIRQNGKSGLQYNSGNHLMVYDTEFEEHTEHGVDITGAGATEDVTFHHCSFLRNGGYGIKINNANVVGTTIESECFFAENTSGDYLDNGSNTVIQALREDAGIADAVWDELYAGHTITGSYGALMNDLKDEAFGKWTMDPVAKTLTLYRSDGITVLKTFNLTDTVSSVPVFIGRS